METPSRRRIRRQLARTVESRSRNSPQPSYNDTSHASYDSRFGDIHNNNSNTNFMYGPGDIRNTNFNLNQINNYVSVADRDSEEVSLFRASRSSSWLMNNVCRRRYSQKLPQVILPHISYHKICDMADARQPCEGDTFPKPSTMHSLVPDA